MRPRSGSGPAGKRSNSACGRTAIGRSSPIGWARPSPRMRRPGGGAGRRLAIGATARRVGPRRLHRHARVRVRRLRAGAAGLGATGRLSPASLGASRPAGCPSRDPARLSSSRHRSRSTHRPDREAARMTADHPADLVLAGGRIPTIDAARQLGVRRGRPRRTDRGGRTGLGRGRAYRTEDTGRSRSAAGRSHPDSVIRTCIRSTAVSPAFDANCTTRVGSIPTSRSSRRTRGRTRT